MTPINAPNFKKSGILLVRYWEPHIWRMESSKTHLNPPQRKLMLLTQRSLYCLMTSTNIWKYRYYCWYSVIFRFPRQIVPEAFGRSYVYYWPCMKTLEDFRGLSWLNFLFSFTTQLNGGSLPGRLTRFPLFFVTFVFSTNCPSNKKTSANGF